MQSFMNGLFHVGEWISKFAVTNILWLLVNLPILLIVINMVVVGESELVILSICLIAMLAPFFFFPATAAMFCSARDFVLQKETSGLVKSFFSFFLSNYKKSSLGGLLLTTLWLIWAVDYYYFSGSNIILMFAFLGMGIPLFVYTINFFIILAHYDISLKAVLKKSLLLTFGNIKLTMTICILSFIIFYVSVNGFLFLLLFFSGSITAFVVFSSFYKYYVSINGEPVQN